MRTRILYGTVLLAATALAFAGATVVDVPAPSPADPFAPATVADCNGNGVDDTLETELHFTQRLVSTDYAEATVPADLDGDGDVDILAGDPISPLRWYENLDGLGTFGTAVPIDAATGLSAVADVDGDSAPDVVRLTGPIVQWFPNDGSGGFGVPGTVYTLALGWQFEDGFTIADLDGDGDPDIVATRQSGGTFETFWLENDGGPTWPFHAAAVHTGLIDLIAADLDGDGDEDLVTSLESEGSLEWYENTDGAGSFAATPHPIADGFHGDLFAADLNGDHDLDVAADVFFPVAGLWWYENVDGSGSFVPGEHVWPEDAARVDGADLDGDGDVDLLAAIFHTSSLSWFENTDGSGAFGTERTVAQAFFPTSVIPADIDGDANIDVVATWYTPDFPDGLITWHRNDSGDCDGNRVPDTCQADCNLNGIADVCDLRGATSIDCDGNGAPDECDTACVGACDADGDLCVDDTDSDPGDPFVCGDVDADGCDDCTSGSFDPANDGANADGDPYCDFGDCDPAENEVWADPGPARQLLADRPGTLIAMQWQPPVEPGGADPYYDVLRSPVASDFVSTPSTLCIETNDADLAAEDTDVPLSGEVFYYLVRAENDCPLGAGSLGTDSAGFPRAGRSCE